MRVYTGFLQTLHNIVEYVKGFPTAVLNAALVYAVYSIRGCRNYGSRKGKAHGIEFVSDEEPNVGRHTVLPQPGRNRTPNTERSTT